jgi:hypothetical protein
MCLKAIALDETFGAVGGGVLRRFLADLRAADCFSEVPLLALSPLSGNEAVLDVGAGITMVIRANHQKLPLTADGKVNWPVVDRLLIQNIDQTHE